MRIGLLLWILSVPLAAQTSVGSYAITRLAGASQARIDGIAASDALLQSPFSLAQDRTGNLYVSDAIGVAMITVGGQLRVVNYGTPFFAKVGLNTDLVANDPLGEVLITYAGRLIRRFSNGSQITIAGGGNNFTFGEGIPATLADLRCISGVTSDRVGNIYVSCLTTGVVRRISPDGSIRTIAGTFTPGSSGDNGPGTRAQITPSHMTIDNSGSVLVYDAAASSIRRIATDGTITTIGGGGSSTQDGAPALTARLEPVGGIAVDATNNIYVSEPSANRIRRFLVGGTIGAFAGSPATPGDSGDGGAVGAARLNGPTGLLTDRDGNLLIADTGNHRVRKTTGGFAPSITAVAGATHFRGDGGRALDALLSGPASVAVDDSGNIYITDTYNFRVRRITANGIISTIAGGATSTASGDGGPATAAQLKAPSAAVVNKQGVLYFADIDRIRAVSATGIISTLSQRFNGPLTALAIRDDGTLYAATSSSISVIGPNTVVNLPTAADWRITGIAVDAQSNIYVSDEGNHVVWRINAANVVQVIAGNPQRPGPNGDGGQARSALLNRPKGVAVDANGVVFVADAAGTLIRRITPDGIIRTVAGGGGSADPVLARQALNTSFGQIAGLSVDNTTGQIYYADAGLGAVGKLTVQNPARLFYVSGDNQTGGTESVLPDQLIVRITDLDLVPVVGVPVDFYVLSGIAFPASPTAVSGIDGAAAMTVSLGTTTGTVKLAASAFGIPQVIFTITVIPRSTPQGPNGTNYSVLTYAGMPYPSDDGAILRAPDSIAVDADNTIYFSDPATNRILARGKDGPVRPFAGNGIRGFGVTREFAYNVRLSGPTGVAVGPNSNVYFADRDNNRICRVTGDGVFEVVLTTGGLRAPSSVAVDGNGQVYIADTGSYFIRLLRTDGTLVNVAGTGAAGVADDGAPANQSVIGVVRSLALDAQDTLYFIENDRVRKITTDGLLGSVVTDAAARAVSVDAQGVVYIATDTQVTRVGVDGVASPIAAGTVSSPLGLAADTQGNLYIADTGNQLIRRANLNGTVENITGRAFTSGDGDYSVLTILDLPFGLAIDAVGNLFIGDITSRSVRRVGTDGIIRTVASNVTPGALAVDIAGSVYFSTGSGVRKVDTLGAATNVNITTPLSSIGCLTTNNSGELVICNGNTVQRLLPGGELQTIAGSGNAGFNGDGGPAPFAQISSPRSVAFDSNGNFYIADRGNLRVRKVANGIVSTFAGSGKRGTSVVEGVPAVQADFDDVVAVAVDQQGNVYIAETNRIRKASPSGIIVTIAGGASFGFDGEMGTGAGAQFDGITAMVMDGLGNLYVSDSNNHRVRKLTLVN